MVLKRWGIPSLKIIGLFLGAAVDEKLLHKNQKKSLYFGNLLSFSNVSQTTKQEFKPAFFFLFFSISIILTACRPHFVRASGVWWIDGEMVKSLNFPFSCPSHANKIEISFKRSTLHLIINYFLTLILIST